MKKSQLIINYAIYIFSILSICHAETIPVNAPNDVVASDGLCSISEAIINANDDAVTHGDCLGGVGADIIVLNNDVLLQTKISDATFGGTGTPTITSDITINGMGFSLQRDSTLVCTIDGSSTIDEFRVLRVDASGILSLDNIEIANGCSDGGVTDVSFGGGIYNAGSLSLTNTSFTNNVTSHRGGGIYNNGQISILQLSTFFQNATQLIGSNGGGIYNSNILGSISSIESSVFIANSSTNDGGAIYNFRILTSIKNSTFSQNTAGKRGGAIATSANLSFVTNCSFVENEGETYSTIIGSINSITNSLFKGNVTTHPSNLDCSASGGTNNLTDKQNSGCPGVSGLTASTIGPLADNGGPTLTHALLGESEAINASTAGTTTDQRGIAAEGMRDIGAYEAQVPAVTPPSDITMEATGPMTAVTLGTATVIDADDSGLLGNADNLGPFSVGEHTITWTATDSLGHIGTATQTITITDTTPAVITTPADITKEATGVTTDVTLGTATAVDLVDGSLTPLADIAGPFTVGIHTITWSVTDAAGNPSTSEQTVTITDTTPPTVLVQANITMEATGIMTAVTLGSAIAVDIVDGVLIPSANMSSPFIVGVHPVEWSVTDTAGNTGTSIQTVTITDTTPPTITLLGNTQEVLSIGDSYTDANATATDSVDGDLTAAIMVANPVNTSQAGNYTITYDVTDNQGNNANQVTRLVKVQASIGGTVTGLIGSNTITLSDGNQTLNLGNGVFTFNQMLDSGSNYSLTLTQPTGSPVQTCSMSNGTGIITNSNIENINIDCSMEQFFVGGTTSGLANGNLVRLQLAAENLVIFDNAAFIFQQPLDDTSNYEINVIGQPTFPSQTCNLLNSTGVISGGDVTNVEVNCETNTYSVGGSVVGLYTGNSLILQNNNADDLLINQDGNFDFVTKLEDLSTYHATISSQPNNPIQICTIANGFSTILGKDVTTIEVYCERGDLIYLNDFE